MPRILTEKEAHEKGMIQLTSWASTGSKVSTVSGVLDYDKWCTSEGDRVKKSGRRAELVARKNDADSISLFVEPVAGCEDME